MSNTPTGVSVEGKGAGVAAVIPPVVTAPVAEAQAPKELRQQLKAANRAAKNAEETLAKQSALLEQLKSADPRELSKAQREVEATKAELTAKEAAIGKYTSIFETMYTTEIEALPEAARESVKALSANGDWPERIEALRAAKALMGPGTAAPQGAAPLNPARGTPQMPTEGPKSVADFYKARQSLSGAFKSSLAGLQGK